MNPNQQEFILKNRKRLSARQIAKQLDLPRKEVEAFLQSGTPLSPAEVPARVRKDWILPAALFLFALALRLLYIYYLRKTPFFEPLSATLDDGVYDKMSREILAGGWMKPFPNGAYRIPLYPYFLAAVYSVSDAKIFWAHAVQSFFGALGPVLVYGIVRRAFADVKAAMLAGLIAAVYLPFIFFENLLLGESLSIFFNLTGLWFSLVAVGRKKKISWPLLLAGLSFGISTLFRPNTLLAVMALAVYFFLFFGESKKAAWRGFLLAGVFLAGALGPIVPVAVKNVKLYHDFVPLSAVGGVNFYVGNNPEADGKFNLTKGLGTGLDEMIANSQQIAERAEGRALKPSEASGYWMRQALSFIAGSPMDSCRLFLKKTAFFFNAYEFPDILDIRFVAQFIPRLGAAVFGYGLVTVLAIGGWWMVRKKLGSGGVLLTVFFAAYAVSVILFFITARYRLPAVPVLIIFASLCLSRLIWGGGPAQAAGMFRGVPVVCLAAAAILVFWPVEITDFATNYNTLAVSLKKKGDFTAAERYYRKAIEISPNYPSPYYNLALLLEKLGRSPEAQDYHAKFNQLKKQQLAGPSAF